MDTQTLRITFGVVAGCVLVLFYGVTYRSTRTAFSGWWCLSLAGFIGAAGLWVFDGTPLQVVANPTGNCVGVLGGACMWAGGGSLSARRPSRLLVGVVLVVVVVTAALGHPDRNVWSGGAFYLGAMALLVGLSAAELVLALRVERTRAVPRPSYRFALGVMVASSGAIGLYYALRAAVFVVAGPDSRLFRLGFGAQPTTMALLMLLVVVTFSMSALCHEQQTTELRERAALDGMTGLLNRTEFLRRAQVEIDAGMQGRRCAVVVADLDRFKALNDGYGHDAGDRALLVFAELCRQVVGGDGFVGRLGGDEFAVLLYDGGLAEQVVEEIAVRLATREFEVGVLTASFGIAEVGAEVDAEVDIAAVVTHGDIALYQAKAAGRACAVRFDGRVAAPVQTYAERAATTAS